MANLSDIFRFVNFGVGGVMVLGGISQFFPMSFQSIVIGCYVILFGLGMRILPPPPPQFWAHDEKTDNM